MKNEVLWVEKYRPQRVADCILPPDLKKTFQDFVDSKVIPNMTLPGAPGIGKTTVARAMLEELGCDYIVINGSLNGNIDTLRNEIKDFASTMSLQGGRKYVILDEADYLNPNSVMPALRNFMEEYSANCGFILTCNYPKRIIDALLSRCPPVEFKIEASEKPKLATQFFKRVLGILEAENVTFEKEVVGEIIMKFFPDWRRVLNELQNKSSGGVISSAALKTLGSNVYLELVSSMKSKNFKEIRKWVGENSDVDSASFFRNFYENAYSYVKPDSVPQLVIHLADYQYKAAFVADQEVNNLAFLIQIMVDCSWN